MQGKDQRPASSASEDESSASGSDAESEQAVELLATSRAKRATAGNRIGQLIQQEQDEVGLLFEKEEGDVDSEEDVDFEGDEDDAGSDAQLDSSSDDEDQGPGKADDDLEGEKELQKQNRLERQKKRKPQHMFKASATVRKKVKVDPTAMTTVKPTVSPTARPKKKAERVSWMPTSEDGPIRASSRRQTMKNKVSVHLRLAEREKERIKQMKHMEEAEKKRKAAKAPPMTQAQRMAEASKIERKNAKSLNRWEEAEKEKAEAIKAKLEALHNRQLTGPVITRWSGIARWVNGKLSQVGMREIKALGEAADLDNHIQQDRDTKQQDGSDVTPGDLLRLEDPMSTHTSKSNVLPEISSLAENTPKVTFAPPLGPAGFLEGIHYYASLPSYKENSATKAFTTATSNGQPTSDSHGIASTLQPIADPESPVPIEHPAAFVEKPMGTVYSHTMLPKSAAPPYRASVEYSSRSLVALRNIDGNATNLPELQASVLLKKRGGKLQS